MRNGAIGATQRVQAGLARLLEHLNWLPTTLVALLPVAASVCFLFMGRLEDAGDWAFLVSGVCVLLVNGSLLAAIGWWRTQDRRGQVNEANRLRVAMKDALQPLTELVASMPYEPKGGRQALLHEVARQAVGSLVLLLKDVYRLRAVVYAMDGTQKSMTPMAYHGRGSSPSPFVLGTTRGDRAIALVREGRSVFVPDLDKEKPEDWKGSGNDYRTFISTAISNGEYAYGMLTVDAPHAQDLGENDLHIVMVVADLLAIAFAEADRS